jgi:hypothetical protein
VREQRWKETYYIRAGRFARNISKYKKQKTDGRWGRGLQNN